MTDIRKLVEDAKTRSNPTSELDRFVDAHKDAPQYEVFEALLVLRDKIKELERDSADEQPYPVFIKSKKHLIELLDFYGRFHTWVSEKHYEVEEEWDFLEGIRAGHEVIEEWECNDTIT